LYAGACRGDIAGDLGGMVALAFHSPSESARPQQHQHNCQQDAIGIKAQPSPEGVDESRQRILLQFVPAFGFIRRGM